MRGDRCWQTLIFTASDDPERSRFDVVLGKGGTAAAMLGRRVTSRGFAAVRDFGTAKDRLGSILHVLPARLPRQKSLRFLP
jgi:hypothetical protein